jgi:hypothetical protein
MSDEQEMQWFYVGRYDTAPTLVREPVTKSSEHCLWIDGRRTNRESPFRTYFQSEESAWTWLEGHARYELETAKTEVQRAHSKIDLIAKNRAGAKR